ncbi:hypothetical protein AGMMS4956_10920 [Bacteroidia bacterium]|nr:hypothetical protein AGMMS4956_10920 [Bacteroidia bacterium]
MKFFNKDIMELSTQTTRKQFIRRQTLPIINKLSFEETLNKFITTAPQNVPLTDDEIMNEIRQVRAGL